MLQTAITRAVRFLVKNDGGNINEKHCSNKKIIRFRNFDIVWLALGKT